jgi:hypothetical protein
VERDLIGWEVVVMRKGMKAPTKLSKLFTSRETAETCCAMLKAVSEPGAYLREVWRHRGSTINFTGRSGQQP